MKTAVQRKGSPGRARLSGWLAGRACLLFAGLGLGLAPALLPQAAAPDLDKAVAALVRISGRRGDAPVRGSGFVVALDGDKATVVTAAHVIEGVQQLQVTFAADSAETFPASRVFPMDAGNPLAAFQVRGALPAGVAPLGFEVVKRPAFGEALFLLGFPQMEPDPRTTQRVLAGRRATLLVIDQKVGEGFSGGPVLQGGKVVGVVTDMDEQTTYAVNAVVAREALEGWGVKLGPPVCTPGEGRTENGIPYVRICAGTFTMGSATKGPNAYDNENPAHPVTVSDFWIGKTEITNAQYRSFKASHKGEANLPVSDVTWVDANAACEHFGGRLPTEAEWEYAARAGSQKAWSFGDDEKQLGEYAWYDGNSSGKAHPVGQKKANAWGLYDMLGNVWEWVSDWYGPYTSGVQANPPGLSTGTVRVLRGGSFRNWSTFLRPAVRVGGSPESRDRERFIGFRCVQSALRQP